MSDSDLVGGKHSKVSSWGFAALLVAGFAVMNGVFVWFDPSLQQNLLYGVRRFAGLEQRNGFLKRTYHDSDGTLHTYMVFVPDPTLRAGQPPLVVYLNGHGENGDDCLAPLRNGLAPVIWEDERAFPFVVVWPQCDKGDQWVHGSRSSERALAIMRDVAEEFRTDPDRVYLTGISSGGTGTWAIAAGNPDLFAAILPMSAVASGSDVEKVVQAKLPVWSFFVSEDGPGLADTNRKTHQTLLEAGASSRLTELSIKGNIAKDAHDAWSFAFRDGGLYRWLTSHTISHRQDKTPLFDLIDLSSVHGSVNTESERQPGNLIRIRPTMDATPLLISGEQASTHNPSEIHLEFRATETLARLGVGLFPPGSAQDESGVLCELACNDVNSSGLYSWPNRTCVTPAKVLAEHALYNDGWNDLRLKFEQGQIFVELNGWSLLEQIPVEMPTKDWRLGFVAQGDSSAYAEIRNVRFRRGGSGAATAFTPGQPFSAPTHLEKRGNDVPSNSGSLASIVEDWKCREQSNPQLEFTWRTEDFDRFAGQRVAATSQRPVDQKQPNVSVLKLDQNQIHYSTHWKHPRINLSRKLGLKDAAGLQDYLRARAARFVSSSEQLTDVLTLDVTIDDTHRIDEVFDSNGRGHLGIVFERPNVWKVRVGELDDIVWRGPLLAFRPLSGFGFQAESATVLSESAWVSGVQCTVIEETTQNAGSILRRRFWVDPTRGSLILRHTVSVDGQLRELLDIQYSLNQSQAWLPVTWDAVTWPYASTTVAEAQFPGNERLFKTASCKAIDNEPKKTAPTSTTLSHFRPDAVVFDQHANEWFQQVSASERRKLNADEASAMAMNGRLANSNSDSSRFYQIVGVGLLLLVGCWAGVRRVRRMR